MSITDIHPLRAGDLLREARRIAGFSRPRLSEVSGSHANQIAHIEKTHGAGWATMVNLLDACGFEVTVRRKPEAIPAAFEKANEAALLLRGLGYHVENPAEHGVVEGAEWADYLRYDIARLATCEALVLLPGWPWSRGALLEVHIAKALGIQIMFAEDFSRLDAEEGA